jgi:outer membrane lipoprotein-sorting protein
MKSEQDDKALEATIRRAVGSEDARFDAHSWRGKYHEEVSFLESRKLATATPGKRKWRIGRTIMRYRSVKIAASAAIAAGVAIAIIAIVASGGGSAVAFATVLDELRTKSYAFEMDISTPGGASASIKCMVLEPGKMRLEPHSGPGGIISVVDSRTGKVLVLFERAKAALRFDKQESREMGPAGFLVLSGRSIENLWNLRVGGEVDLGKREIAGKSAEGFRVTQKALVSDIEKDDATETITVWADTETHVPITIDVLWQSDKEPQPSQRLTLRDFKVVLNPDPALFSTDVPEGYTLANQQTIGELAAGQAASAPTEAAPSAEAKKVLQAMDLWNGASKEKAVELLLTVDWNGDFRFGPEDYLFTMTERQLISLVSADQLKVSDEVIKQLPQCRAIARELAALGRQARASKDVAKAQECFNAAAGLGQLLDRNENMLLIVRLVGITVQKMAIADLSSLYEGSGETAKCEAVRKRLKQLDEEQAAIKTSVAR